jgi:hypothetical protein
MDLSRYLASIGELEEAISFRAFHPFFVRWLFPVRAARARAAYRYLFEYLESVMEQRLQRRERLGAEDERPRDIIGRLVDLNWSRPMETLAGAMKRALRN